MNTMNISYTIATRSASVVPFHGFGMGDVCPMTDVKHLDSVKRRATAAVQATAWSTPGSGQPWSPPVT